MLAITHLPSPHMNRAVRTYIDEAPIDLDLARAQHEGYCGALAECGAEVRRLDVNVEHPDCVFIEDTAIVLDELAIVCSMGHSSRRPEPAGVEPVLSEYREIRRVELPATIDGGDVLRVGRTLLVGLSARTNFAAAEAIAELVRPLGYRVQTVRVTGCLHLKSAVTALPDQRLMLNRAWLEMSDLAGFSQVPLPADEPDAANVALVGEVVCASSAHPGTISMIRELGFDVRAIDLSEFAKAEGCVTCLSLLLNS